jgi:hypothetical protein
VTGVQTCALPIYAVSGIIQTVAGDGFAGFSGDGGPATSAGLNYPFGLALDSSGHLFIADANNNRIREVVLPPFLALSPSSLNFGTELVASTTAPKTVTVQNTGTATAIIASIAPEGDFAQTNTCGASIAAGATCTISVTFTPAAQGPRSGSLTLTDNASGSPQVVSLSGIGAPRVVHWPGPIRLPTPPRLPAPLQSKP